ncbi:MAG TPA: hypothetical protein VEA69_06095 [Tepidisphaeraceae bacterium]|nr:hypothetical protein [Tepidisphaeraceae bacterium]
MTDPASTSDAPLDYAPTSRRRGLRLALRLWPVWLLGVVAGVGVAYGPGAWRHCKLMRLQAACMTAQMPQDRPAEETDPAAASALLAAWPAEYRTGMNGSAARVDPRWAALSAELGMPPWPSGPAPSSTAFCHERHTPDGRRRLLVVEGFGAVTVIEPGRWAGADPRVLWRAHADGWGTAYAACHPAFGETGPTRVMGGSPDPADPSRLTVRFIMSGVSGTFEFRLTDQNAVAIRLLDPGGFDARALTARLAAQAARERAATRPAVPEGGPVRR